MTFVIHALDHIDSVALRNKHYPEHIENIRGARAKGITINMSGPLTDGKGNSIGSLLLVEADSREVVDAFVASEPFVLNGVWEKTDVHEFIRRT